MVRDTHRKGALTRPCRTWNFSRIVPHTLGTLGETCQGSLPPGERSRGRRRLRVVPVLKDERIGKGGSRV